MGSLDDGTSLKHINLQLGWPTPSLFPTQALASAAQHVLMDESTSAQALVYGRDPGHHALREATASWLGHLYHLKAEALPSAENIFVTNGASTGVSYLLSQFTDPSFTRMIWMVEPTYFLACPIFEQAGFKGRLRGVPEDNQGIDLAYLRAAIAKVDQEYQEANDTQYSGEQPQSPKTYRHVIYAVPTFSNPSAKTMSVDRRIELIRFARESDALIISDDVYDALHWVESSVDGITTTSSRSVPPRLVDIDRQLPGCTIWGNAVSNGSFSKIVAPGVRVGWIDGSPEIVRQLCKVGPVVSGGCQSHMSAMMICQLLETGLLQKHIDRTLIPTYRRRYHTMRRAIEELLLPLGVTIAVTPGLSEPADEERLAGGFFLLLNMNCSSATVQHLAEVALRDFNLRIAAGSMMVVAGDTGSVERAASGFGCGIRLCWAWHEEDEIIEGIQRLNSAYSKIKKDVHLSSVLGNLDA